MTPAPPSSPALAWRPSLGPGMVLAAVIAAGFAARLWLMAETFGSTDLVLHLRFAQMLERFGLLHLYRTEPMFNHPPPIAGWELLSLRLDHARLLAFPFWMRLLGFLGDVGSAAVLFRIWRARTTESGALAAVAIFTWSPVALLVTGFHGNTDPLLAFFCLLSAALLDRRRWFWGGVALAAACNVKLLPVLLVLPLLIGCPDFKSARRFAGGLCLGIVPYLPLLFGAPDAFVRNVLAYRSNFDVWGIPALLLAAAHHPAFAEAAHALIPPFQSAGRWGVLGLPVVLAILNRRRHWRLGPLEVATLSLALFLVVTPGFGVQYLEEIVPLLAAVSAGGSVAYGLLGGSFLALVYYGFWTRHGPPAALFTGPLTPPATLVGLLTWAWLIRFVEDRVRRAIRLAAQDFGLRRA